VIRYFARKMWPVCILAGSLVIPGLTSAFDAKLDIGYTGSRCVESGDRSPEIDYYGTMARNDGTSTETFSCPSTLEYISIVPGTTSGYEFKFTRGNLAWSAVVDDQHSSADISCVLKACTYDDSSCLSSATDSSTGTGIEELGASGPSGVTAYPLVALRCDVPGKVGSARSAIVSYVVNQKNTY
jgi:hypothetical protein